jgi:glutathione synthase/RimK-type ligase-like ATP-grasp enzyme
VAEASNKLTCFNLLEAAAVRTPEWTTNQEVAQAWLDDGDEVVIRTVLNGHSGRGIVLASEEGMCRAPLYTKYVKKKHEYRVHVVGDRVVDIQQKRKSTAVEDVNYKIRSHDNGFVFCRENIDDNPDVCAQAVAALQATSLDFGAVDVIWNEKRREAYVLEINTAPGMEGATVNNYAEALSNA